MEEVKEHPDHERARNAGRISPDHGDGDNGDAKHPQRRRQGPTPGHPTVILNPEDITSAQIGPGGLGDLVPPDEIDPGEDGEAPRDEENGKRRD